MVFNMEPPFPPVLVGIFEFILYVLGGKVLFQLKSRTPDYIHFFHGGVRLEAEKCAEKFEVRRDFEECFAQMYEDRKVDDGIGIKMYVLKSVKVQNSSEKIRSRQGQPPLNEMGEHYRFRSMNLQGTGSCSAAHHPVVFFSCNSFADTSVWIWASVKVDGFHVATTSASFFSAALRFFSMETTTPTFLPILDVTNVFLHMREGQMGGGGSD